MTPIAVPTVVFVTRCKITLDNLSPGTIVDERYELLQHIGDGGMGRVYLAREQGLERLIALKVLHSTLTGDQESRLRFAREGKLLSKLFHPYLVCMYRFGFWQSAPYIAMEYIAGSALSDLIESAGALPLERVQQIAVQLCEAIQFVHDQGVIHRDLKPSNMKLTEGGDLKVLDFGLARAIGNETQTQQLTMTGQVVGSLYYLSPEQCMGRPGDKRSDVYAAGCVLFECLTGHPPFDADNPVVLIQKHVCEVFAGLPAHLTGSGMNEVLFKALAKQPDERYQSMNELKEDLEKLSRGSTLAHGFSTRRSPRRRLVLPLVLLSSILSILAFASHKFLWQTDTWQSPEELQSIEPDIQQSEEFVRQFKATHSKEQKARYALLITNRNHLLAMNRYLTDGQTSRVRNILLYETSDTWRYLPNGASRRISCFLDLSIMNHRQFTPTTTEEERKQLLSQIRKYLDKALECWPESQDESMLMEIRLRRALNEVDLEDVKAARLELQEALKVCAVLTRQVRPLAGTAGNLNTPAPYSNRLVRFARELPYVTDTVTLRTFETKLQLSMLLLELLQEGTPGQELKELVLQGAVRLFNDLNQSLSGEPAVRARQLQQVEEVKAQFRLFQVETPAASKPPSE